LISTSVVGVADGEGDGVVEALPGVGGEEGDAPDAGEADDFGAGDCASRLTAHIAIATFNSKNRDMTVHLTIQ
jgi:hypothetical protein